ncbi:MAG: serine hydrolase domain-containing protein [Planctomycetota bacterium]
MKIRALVPLLFLVIPSSLIVRASAAPVAQSPQPDLTQKIDALAASCLAQPGGVGLSIAVGQRGKILLAKGYGKADAELDAPANEQTMFRIGSVTKQFTAALVMRLVEQKKLLLQDDLSKYVPEFPLQGRKVTIEQLLQHTSGIKCYTQITTAWQKQWPLELTNAEVLALVKDAPFDFEPGTRWSYSNTGYYLLSMVIEKVAGKSYAEQLQAEICVPLGLERTRYDSNRDLIRNRAQGYALEGEQLVNDQVFGMSQPGGAGGILSTAGELVRWQMALTAGKVVAPESFSRMRKATVLPDGKDTEYGFGLRMSEWADKPRVWHGGGIFGFNSILFWLPTDDLHVAVISNSESISSAELADAVARAALGTGRLIAKDEPVPAELVSRLSGEWVFTDIGMNARIFESEGKLMMQASGQDGFRVQWQGGLEFRAEFDNEVKLVFGADGKSLVVHQGGRKTEAVRK